MSNTHKAWMDRIKATIAKRMLQRQLQMMLHVWHDTSQGARITLCGTSTSIEIVTALPRRLWQPKADPGPGYTYCPMCSRILELLSEEERTHAFAE